jgi:hypothetical protein
MNLETGKIEFLPPNEKPRLGHVELSPVEVKILHHVPEDLRPFELAWLRVHHSKKWTGMDRFKKKEAFRQGWNAAIYMKAKGIILNEKETKEAQIDLAMNPDRKKEGENGKEENQN